MLFNCNCQDLPHQLQTQLIPVRSGVLRCRFLTGALGPLLYSSPMESRLLVARLRFCLVLVFSLFATRRRVPSRRRFLFSCPTASYDGEGETKAASSPALFRFFISLLYFRPLAPLVVVASSFRRSMIMAPYSQPLCVQAVNRQRLLLSLNRFVPARDNVICFTSATLKSGAGYTDHYRISLLAASL